MSRITLNSSLTAATRIDHCFAHETLLPAIRDILYMPEPGASDHCALILLGCTQEVQLAPSFRLFKIHQSDLLDADFSERLTQALQDVPETKSICSFRSFMASIKLTATRELSVLKLPVKSIDREVENARIALHRLQLSLTLAKEFSELVNKYEFLRRSSCSDERADFLRLQPDLPIWSKKRFQKISTPLDGAAVTAFFQELYLTPQATDATWQGSTMKLLRTSLVHFTNPEELVKPVTGDEVLSALKDFKRSSAPGLNGIPVDAFLAGHITFATFVADVLNATLDTGSDQTDYFNFVARGTLLFKDKPGNKSDDPNAYRPLSVLDVEARLLHAVVGNRLKTLLKDCIPATQQGFLPRRDSRFNVVKLLVLAECNSRSFLRRPGILISQGQHKAYDVLLRDWVLTALSHAGASPAFCNLVSALWGGSSIVFQVDDGLCPPVLVGRGLPQGAMSSVMLYILAYQPFIDAWEASGGGISVHFGDASFRTSSISYADNSDFFIGSEQEFANFNRLRALFDRVSGSTINPRESFATVLSNGGSTSPEDWTNEALGFYPERKEGAAFDYLGRLICMDGSTCPGLEKRITKALRKTAFHVRRHFSLFSTARALHTYGFSKIALLLDGPYDYEKAFTTIRNEASKYFHDGNGRSIRWDLLVLPRDLGGLGLLDPLLSNEASLALTLIAIFTGPHEQLRGQILHIMDVTYRELCGCGLSAFLAKREKAANKAISGHQSFGRRCLFALNLFGLSSALPADLTSADPAEIVLLPFHSSAYGFDLSNLDRSADWERCVEILRGLGVTSFLDLLWRADPPRTSRGTDSVPKLMTLSIRPPQLDEVRAHHPHVEFFDKRCNRRGLKPRIVFDLLARNWTKLLRLWPPALVHLLERFVVAHPDFNTRPLRGTSGATPHDLRTKPILPFSLLKLADRDFTSFTAKAGRKWFYGSRCAQPGNPSSTYKGSRGIYMLRPGDDLDPCPSGFDANGFDDEESDGEDFEVIADNVTLPSASAWRRKIYWKKVWPFLHELQLPGIGRTVWWLILHMRAAVLHTAAYKVARCPGCCSITATSDHVYLECPHFRLVWLSFFDVLKAVLAEPFDISLVELAEPGAVALGFPDLSNSLSRIGKLRLKVWVSICMSVIHSAIQNLPRGDASRTPASLQPERLRTICVKEMFRFICLFHAGPTRLSTEKFTLYWLDGNDLIAKEGTRLFLQNTDLIPPSAVAPADDLGYYDDQPQSLAPTVEGSVAVRSNAPANQAWSKDRTDKRNCRCCHAQTPVWERTTILCAGCFVARFPEEELEASARRSFNTMKRTCTTCEGGQGSREMTWNFNPKDYSCKCCGLQRQRIERKSKTCIGCFERNTGLPLPSQFDRADKRPGPCSNCPPPPTSASQTQVAGPSVPSKKRPKPARDTDSAAGLSQREILLQPQEDDIVLPAVSQSSAEAGPSRKRQTRAQDTGLMAKRVQKTLTDF